MFAEDIFSSSGGDVDEEDDVDEDVVGLCDDDAGSVVRRL